MDGQMIALCREALDYATHNGVEKAECYLQLSKVTEVDIIGGVLSQMNSIYREEVLVRIIKDQRSVSSLISSFNFDCIAKAVDECIGAVEYVEPDAYEDISDGPLKYFYTDRDSAIDPKSLVLLAQHYLDEVHRHYPNIEISELRLPAVEVFSVFGNTNDVLLTHAYTKYDCFVEYMSCAETQQCSYYYDFSFSSLPLHLLDLFDQRFWYECIGRISDIRQPAFIKKCQILLAPSVVEDILIDGVYTLTNSVAIMSDASIWRDRMHSCVADKRLSIALDPYNENIVSGERITDNGTISQPFFLIRNGILENFYLTRKAALISGFPMAPNTSDSIVLTGGTKTLDALISKIDQGIVISRYSGGEISPEGDFNGLAKNCLFIENGKIVSIVGDIRVYGNVLRMLNGIDSITIDHNKNGYNVVPWILMNAGIYLEDH